MDNLPMDALLTQIQQTVSPYVGGAQAALQRAFAETPTPLLISIVVDLLLVCVLRGVLIVAGLAVVVLVAVWVFGIAVPGLGRLEANMEDKNPYELDAGPVAAPHPADVRRAQSVQTNAPLSLEGMPVNVVDFAIQEAVIAGTLTPDEAVAKHLERTRGANQ